MPAENPRVVAVIPVLNEEGAIGPTLARMAPCIDLVIVVDGGSKDGTVAEARAHGAEVLVEPRRGYGRACLSGAERAQALGAEYVFFMDGDGADAVDRAADLLAPLERGEAGFTIATRAGATTREEGSMGWHQLLAGQLIGAALGLICGTRYTDMCAFRALRVADLMRLGMTEMTYGWNLEMQIKAPRAGLRVLEVPLPYYRRVAGESKVAGNLRGTFKAGTRILATLVRHA
jgi:glycosyltransferase involved in cell wall biosynthesis